MTLIMRDSINAPLIPADTPVVAGYGDGAFIWSPNWVDGSNWWDLFPQAVKLVIVVNAAHSGDILDVERGDASPADVPGWLDRFDRPGRRRPTVYSDRSTHPFIVAAANGRPFDWWAATLDGTQQVAGAVAVQYTDTGAYDESVILDPAWVGLQPPPPPPPLTPEEIMVIRNPADGAVYVVDPGGKRHLGGLEYGAWKQTPGYTEISVDAATVAEIPDVSAPPTVDVNALAAALATHPFTATLNDAERDAIATHVLMHLSKDAAAG